LLSQFCPAFQIWAAQLQRWQDTIAVLLQEGWKFCLKNQLDAFLRGIEGQGQAIGTFAFFLISASP
jgi:hypothetical protein